jgi:hypothetical protein
MADATPPAAQPDPRNTDLDDDSLESAAPLRDDDVVDVLPDDLDAHGLVGPYMFPDNSRRRVPGIIYLVTALLLVALYVFTKGNNPVLVNGGTLGAAIALALLGVYHLQAGWHLAVDENDALVAATRAVGFPVGHASAQLAWRGVRSRPTWRVLVYSNEEPPTRRGLVMVDGVDAEIIGQLVEENPEDWSELK